MIHSKPHPQGAERDYRGALERRAISFRDVYPWLSVGHTSRVQGWKLHLSSIPTEAHTLLDCVLPILRDQAASFKLTRNPSVLMQMNEGLFGIGQIGKFMTIYPETDAASVELAHMLSNATAGFAGPEILTDVNVGGVVYARFGAFNPLTRVDRLGQLVVSIHGPDGSEVGDSYQIPFVPPHDRPNPFAKYMATPLAPKVTNDPGRLFGPGFLLTDVLQAHPKGSVFRGVDLRRFESVRGVVVKEGRAHCCSDEHGRDMRTRLRRQLTLHESLADYVNVPRVDSYFEDGGNGYLVMDYLDGATLGERYERSWPDLKLGERRALLKSLAALAETVQRLHGAGYVHRDLTPTNVLVDSSEQVWLLDLELTHELDDKEPVIELGTPGFMSPQQRHLHDPAPSDDVYSFGASLIRLLTNQNPHNLLFQTSRGLTQKVLGLAKGAPGDLVDLACACVSERSSERPSVSQLVKRLKACAETLDNAETSSPLRPTSGEGRPSEINTLGGLNGLLEAVAIDQKSGMWLSPSVDSPGSVELLRGTNRGVAGVLYVLSRLQRTGVEIPGARNKAKAAVGWLVATPKTRAEMLPGLHFGECGVAVALAEAAVAGTTSLESVSPLIEQALEGPLDWPDMTHGAAGQGTAALIISDLLPKNGWDDYAHRCADYLTRSQSKDGSWQMPAGVSGLEGETFYGFAHGAAGIIYFLASYAARFEASDVDRAWKHASEWLQANAVDPEAAALEWRWSSHQETIWNYWCHGAPGIGLAFLRMYQISGDEHYAEVARRALDAPHESISHPSLSQCHGLAGIGEIYLEAARVLDDPEYRARAHRAAHTLSWLSSESERGGSSWLVEHPAVGTGDLMVGSGGIVHFLHRVQCRDPLSPPLLLEE